MEKAMVWYPSEYELEGQEHTIDLNNAGCQDLPTGQWERQVRLKPTTCV